MNVARKLSAYQILDRRTRGLYRVAYHRAFGHEPTPRFPGVDIDVIHYKRGAVRKMVAA